MTATQTTRHTGQMDVRLAQILCPQENICTYRNGYVPIGAINRFEQVRKTIDPSEVEPLANSISTQGLMQPALIALFDGEEIQQYLFLLNMLWKTEYSVSELRTYELRERTVYPVLIYGHRRLRACELLLERRTSKKRLPDCFRNSLTGMTLEVRIGENMSAFEALRCQFAENTYVPPRPEQLAGAYDSLYHLLSRAREVHAANEGESGNSSRKLKDRLSYEEFAQVVGVGVTKVRQALRYRQLPLSMQEAVENNVLVYGIACELARLVDSGCPDHDLHYWLRQTVANRYTVVQLRTRISKVLENRRADAEGQGLLGIMNGVEAARARTRCVQTSLMLNTQRGLLAALDFVRKVSFLGEQGYLSQKDSPFLDVRTLTGLSDLLMAVHGLSVHLETLISNYSLLQLQADLERGNELCHLLQERLQTVPLDPPPLPGTDEETVLQLVQVFEDIRSHLPELHELGTFRLTGIATLVDRGEKIVKP